MKKKLFAPQVLFWTNSFAKIAKPVTFLNIIQYVIKIYKAFFLGHPVYLYDEINLKLIKNNYDILKNNSLNNLERLKGPLCELHKNIVKNLCHVQNFVLLTYITYTVCKIVSHYVRMSYISLNGF